MLLLQETRRGSDRLLLPEAQLPLPAMEDACPGSRGYPICSYSLFCLDGYSLDTWYLLTHAEAEECKSIACGEQQTCEDFGQDLSELISRCLT